MFSGLIFLEIEAVWPYFWNILRSTSLIANPCESVIMIVVYAFVCSFNFQKLINLENLLF